MTDWIDDGGYDNFGTIFRPHHPQRIEQLDDSEVTGFGCAGGFEADVPGWCVVRLSTHDGINWTEDHRSPAFSNFYAAEGHLKQCLRNFDGIDNIHFQIREAVND